ncbi:phage tail tape measure protein, lambda family [Dyella jiangningensis]|uniref:phage tail tape measure protein n=1 Tax=Dyella sp. AtDHG13 TaxID=1938897 RepID=UPI00088EA900|nr:phage tail tape measure protein [Dyella sp. AtDHG13]PXV60656.1 lambda family phage tail tape measure protein [Dyella sp. AtDHG13]SDJ54004.1 phage tail tape measure protein, lambda family [Dyella jiangningensis]
MATVAVLQTDLLLNSAAFRTGMVQAAQTATEQLGAIQAEAQRTAASIDMMRKAVEGFVGFEVLKNSLGALVDTQVQMQQIHYTLVSATGSAAAAGEQFDFLKQKAEELGLNLPVAAQAFGQLAAAASASNIPMDQTQKLFTAFGEASTTLHLSSEQSQHALLALTEMMSRGTIQARQLNQQLGFAIPGSAARFKNAVMDAIQGTDLAGKSFEELEKAGDLVTSRFMPQLIQALEQSGRGWEEAAGGLNAQINRLHTAWFDLKNDISSGLFNDAATSGIKFVADNLDHIAATVEILGGLAAARLISIPITSVYTGVTSSLAQRQAAADQAAADLAVADAQVQQTAAQIKANEAALTGIGIARDQALAARTQAEATYQAALAENEAAQATLAHQASAATLSANIRAQAAATAQAEAAQLALNKAEQQYDAAIVASNTFKEQQIAIEARLLELRAANTTAIEAQTAATAAQEAASVAGYGASMLSKVGTSLVGLVGGPIGLAIIALGTIAYAFAEAAEKGSQAEQEYQAQSKALVDLKQHLDDVNEAYKNIASRPTPTAMADEFKAASKQVSATQQEIDSLKAKIADLQAPNPFGETAGSINNHKQLIDELQARIDQLQKSVDGEQGAMHTLSDNIVNEADPAHRALIETVRELHATFGDASWLKSADDAIDQYLSKVSAADAGLQTETAKLGEEKKKLDQKIAEFGMTASQKTLYEHSQSMGQNSMAGADQKAAADAAAQAVAADQDRLDAMKAAQEAAKKAATQAAEEARKEQNAYESLVRSMKEKIEADQQQLSGGQKLTDADKNLIKVREDLLTNLKNLSPERKQELLDQAQLLVNLTNEVDARQRANAERERQAVLQDKLDRQRELQDQTNARQLEGVGHGSQWNTQQKEFEKLQDQYNKDMDAQGKLFDQGKIGADEYTRSIGQIQSAYTTAVVAQRKFYDDQQAELADWKNGGQAAMENFVTSASNVAGQTESLFTTAFNGMADAMATFATTGKTNFSSLVSSILTDLAKMELRVLESQILQSILGAFLPSGSTGAGDALNGGSNYTGAGSFSTTWAGAPGRASGGPVNAGSLYQVNEDGPELLTTGGNTYLMMGGQGGSVTPYGGSGSSAGAGGVNATISVVVQQGGQSSSSVDSTGENAALGRQVGEQFKAMVHEMVYRMTQPGGILYAGAH